MDDLQRQNFASVGGSVSLITSPFTSAGSALSFGTSGVWSIPDTASSSLPAGDGLGGAALEGWFRVPALPAGTATILGKASSYELKLTPGAHLQFVVSNGGATATVVSAATVTTNNWYHVAGVYNGDYTGPTWFGAGTTVATGSFAIPGDYYHGAATGATVHNLHISKFTCPEKGVLNSVGMDLQCVGDASLAEYVRAVLYQDSGGTISKVAESPDQRLGTGVKGVAGGARNERVIVSFPIVAPLYPQDYYIGVEGGESSQVVAVGTIAGGTVSYMRDDRGSDSSDSHPTGVSADPFISAGTSLGMSHNVFGTYTATGRTGAEGQALLYVNGVQDSTVAYTHGIADSSGTLQHPAGMAVDMADWAIYNKKLSRLQVATHYAAR